MHLSEWKNEGEGFIQAEMSLIKGHTPFLVLRACGPNGNGKWIGVVRDAKSLKGLFETAYYRSDHLAKNSAINFATHYVLACINKELTKD